MFKLRPYQLKAVEFCTQKLAERKNSLLVAATGAGKTIMLSSAGIKSISRISKNSAKWSRNTRHPNFPDV